MNSPGVALFHDGKLFAADRVRIPPAFADHPAGQRWLGVALEIVAWINSQKVWLGTLSKVVFECPQWYQRGKSKGDPNQLVGVAGVAANLTGMLITKATIAVLSPTPAEWIGQLPKTCPRCKGVAKKKCAACLGSAWKTPRGQRIMSRLAPDELALVPDQNDAIDSVGLGLWALGRLTPRSVYSNGRDGK